ncbi:hypothetical protein NDN08_007564 [Rhodosorus marinus]|uniref:Uncharacterized protein n=1 Tax=Rhodosorus marinus TaxID=101924 RepID=A0AAV8V0S0_9RHOD|nr:hypothetical protein NDN08_007564 [Rhodosorus marinus]
MRSVAVLRRFVSGTAARRGASYGDDVLKELRRRGITNTDVEATVDSDTDTDKQPTETGKRMQEAVSKVRREHILNSRLKGNTGAGKIVKRPST